MSDTNTTTKEDDSNVLEQSTITMVDVLEQEKEMEEEYAAVLGASDEKACTYTKGAIQRQALYSCLTCCPEARNDVTKSAGICLACSYRCHENHELVELYTKRNFRCDCPTTRIGTNDKRCALNPQLDAVQPPNGENKYNQNFQGLYCKCKRPYPDPERTAEEVMLQCVVCEDWFHFAHLDAPAAAEKWLDACSEMICDTCMTRHEFLRDYTGLAMQSPAAEEPKTTVVDVEKSEEPEIKRPKIEDGEEAAKAAVACRRPKNTNQHKGAAFWTNNWREELCKCDRCLQLYKEHSVEYLPDIEDSPQSYEERGKKRAEENSTYEQGIRALASIGRTQQIDAITEYNRMKDKLKEYLQSFAASKKVVTEEDINRFFAGMRDEKPANPVGQPHFCR